MTGINNYFFIMIEVESNIIDDNMTLDNMGLGIDVNNTNIDVDISTEQRLLQLQNEKNLNTGASGFIVSALRNSVVDYFTEDKTSLIQILEDKIGEFLCPKLSKLSSAISDKTDDLKSKIVA